MPVDEREPVVPPPLNRRGRHTAGDIESVCNELCGRPAKERRIFARQGGLPNEVPLAADLDLNEPAQVLVRKKRNAHRRPQISKPDNVPARRMGFL